MSQNLRSTNQQQVISLLKKLTGGPTLEHYDEILEKLRVLDHLEVQKILYDLLKNKDWRIRLHAGEALLRLFPEASLLSVLPLLKDSDANIRYNITLILADLYDQRMQEELIEVAIHDVDPDVRSNAVIALRNIQSRKTIETLKWIINHDFEKNFEGETVSKVAIRAINSIQQ